MPKFKLNQTTGPIMVALIGLVGAAITGYFVLQAAIRPIEVATSVTQTAEARLPTTASTAVTAPVSADGSENLDSVLKIYSSWQPCTDHVAMVLPDGFVPQENSIQTLATNLPEFETLPQAPIVPMGYLEGLVGASEEKPPGTVLPRRIAFFGAPAPNESTIRLSNIMKVKLDLASPGVDTHTNLLYIHGACGGEFDEPFPPAVLNHDPGSLNQILALAAYDFFSIQPGELVELGLHVTCAAPGIYKMSSTISIETVNLAQDITLPDFGVIVCPDTYSLWTTADDSAAPLIHMGDFFWDGESYEQ